MRRRHHADGPRACFGFHQMASGRPVRVDQEANGTIVDVADQQVQNAEVPGLVNGQGQDCRHGADPLKVLIGGFYPRYSDIRETQLRIDLLA